MNAANPAQSVSRRQLADMFLKKVTHWPDGTTVEPVEPPEKSMTRAYFLSDVMGGKSALALKAFWQKRVFSGRDTPPVEKGSDEEVVAFVKASPGAIGYVAARLLGRWAPAFAVLAVLWGLYLYPLATASAVSPERYEPVLRYLERPPERS